MKIILPTLVKYSIKDIGNKTLQSNALKIYTALYLRSKRKNDEGYFEIPSTYLKKINLRYYRIIDKFIEDGIIDYLKISRQGDDIFTTKTTKYYSTTKNKCMKYKFLIDVEKGQEIEVDLININKDRNWYKRTEYTLNTLGVRDVKISRDDFGRRVHHNFTQTYKDELSNIGLTSIDAKCSQPRLLYLILKEKNITDNEYNYIFENGIDFYDHIMNRLQLKDRKVAKDIFMYWLNSNGYVPNYKINVLFPEVTKFIKSLKYKNYKDAASFMQREEAKIWIDDILENLPVKFGITIHDSIIVRNEDALIVYKFIREKYPLIELDIKEIIK